MNSQQSGKPNLFQTISNLFQYLFIGERDSAHIYWLLAGISLIGVVLRLWKINEPIAYDEAYTFIYFATQPFKQILSDYSAPNNHILHTILVSVSYKILGGQTWIVRLPAFIAGTLCIPAGYFAARRIFNGNQSLAAAALSALTPWFISYSANGRGYTMLTLFALLLTNFAGILVRRQSRSALIAFGIAAVLGFYTIPIFLYPMAGVCLWVLVTYLTTNEPWNDKARKAWTFLGYCALAGVVTFLLYSPVIFFGTGAGSILNNEIVEPRTWSNFVDKIGQRSLKTWEDWMLNIAPLIQYALLVGFLLSLFFYRKASNQRLPLQGFMALAILILLLLQRVAPFPRVWIYLEVFYMLFAGAGLMWLVQVLLSTSGRSISAEKIISTLILLTVLVTFSARYINTRQASVRADQSILPEQQAAEFLATRLNAEDTILSMAPVDYRTAYYLYMNGVPYDVFYERDHPVDIQNAIIILRTNSEYSSPESVTDFFNVTSNLDLPRAELLFEYGPLNVFSVPAK